MCENVYADRTNSIRNSKLAIFFNIGKENMTKSLGNDSKRSEN